MKKIFFALAATALVAVSCNKDGGDDNKVKPLEATLELTTSVAELPYGEPAEILGTVTTTATLDSFTLTAVQKVGEEYSAVGEAQVFAAEGNDMKVEYFADSKDMTDLEVVLKAGAQEAKFYFPATAVGELKGTFWMNDAVMMAATPKVGTYENDPETYPVEGTGAGSDIPSFFSMRGAEVNGEVKHILSLNDAREVGGVDVSMSWVNVLMNTKNNAFIGGQRGLAFVRCNSLTAGTVGRQCDVYEVDGKKIDTEKTDNAFGISAIRGSWAGDRYNEEEYKFVDKLFLDVNKAETKLEKMKAFWAFNQIQAVLDNATLGVEENPTNLSNKNMYRRYVEAGQTSAKEAITEEFRAGDYFIIRTNAGTADAPQYIYGIIQVLQLPDDAYTFTLESEKVPGKMCMDIEKTAELYEKPAYFSIKTQCVR
ncbi:MAG: hypothetical protein E7115_03050 [Bacteroidales bacterium]|nr:hypothetical protein [Bacteroidales bacterium]